MNITFYGMNLSFNFNISKYWYSLSFSNKFYHCIKTCLYPLFVQMSQNLEIHCLLIWEVLASIMAWNLLIFMYHTNIDISKQKPYIWFMVSCKIHCFKLFIKVLVLYLIFSDIKSLCYLKNILMTIIRI